MASVIGLSLVAAFLFAAGSVFQHRAAGRTAHEETMKLSLLTGLLRRPQWLLATVLNVLAFVFELLALRRGSLLVVQPLLVTGLLLALPLSAALHRERHAATEWLGVAAVVGGLIVFLLVGDPNGGVGEATMAGWLAIALACGIPAATLAWAGHCSHGPRRAASLAAAAGILYGLTAALAKASAHLLDRGVVRLFTGWPLYVLVVLAIVSLIVSQSAFQAGRLRTSLPLLLIGEPLVAALIGVLAFHEHLAETPLNVGIAVAGIAVMAGGVLLLAASQSESEALAQQDATGA